MLAGTHMFEEADEGDKYNSFIETIFAIVQPESYKKYKDKKNLQRNEEGVDAVIYHGEDNWVDIAEQFKEFGLENLDLFGEGLKKNGTK